MPKFNFLFLSAILLLFLLRYVEIPPGVATVLLSSPLTIRGLSVLLSISELLEAFQDSSVAIFVLRPFKTNAKAVAVVSSFSDRIWLALMRPKLAQVRLSVPA